MKEENYDKENDILYIHFGKGKVKHSRELIGNFILDFDKDDNVVSIEIFDFMEKIRESDKYLEHIFNNKLKPEIEKIESGDYVTEEDLVEENSK